MASPFNAQFSGALTQLFTQFGDTYSYTPKGGAAGDVTGVFTPGPTVRENRGGALVEFRTGEFKVRTSAVANPQIGDTVVIGGVTYAVGEAPDVDAVHGYAMMRVKEAKGAEAAAGFRGGR